MIAIDSSALITFFKDSEHYVTKEVDRLLKDSSIVLPPVVLAELLSDPALPDELARLLSDLITLQITDGYWQRVGRLRSGILKRKLKARLADAMIAQTCIDHDIPLLTCDSDFRHYQNYNGLKLYKF